VDLRVPQGGKRGRAEEEDKGTFWRGTLIDSDTRLRVGRAIGKDEDEVAAKIFQQLKERGHPNAPPPLASDGQGAYREQMVKTWGQVPPYSGLGRPPTVKQPGPDWQYVQVIKHREGGRVVGLTIKVVYGDPETVLAEVGGHTSYVERSNLSSRQMNGRLVRKTISFSKTVEMLEAASAWEDAIYDMTRTVKTLALEVNEGIRRWMPRTPAMAAGLTDHIWTVKELLTTVVVPLKSHQHSMG
jgi:hypothetical protein